MQFAFEGEMRIHVSSAGAAIYIVVGLGCFLAAYTLLPKGISYAGLMAVPGILVISMGVSLLKLRHLPIIIVEDGTMNYRSPFSRDYESVPIGHIRSVSVKKYSTGRGYGELLDVRGDFTPFLIGTTFCKCNSKSVAAEIERLAKEVRNPPSQ
jgi:hypothetical protein